MSDPVPPLCHPLPASNLPKRPFSFLSTHSFLIHGGVTQFLFGIPPPFQKGHLCHCDALFGKGKALIYPSCLGGTALRTAASGSPQWPSLVLTDILHSLARARSSQLPLRANQRLPLNLKSYPPVKPTTRPVLLPCLWSLSQALCSSLTLLPQIHWPPSAPQQEANSYLEAPRMTCSSRRQL